MRMQEGIIQFLFQEQVKFEVRGSELSIKSPWKKKSFFSNRGFFKIIISIKRIEIQIKEKNVHRCEGKKIKNSDLFNLN